MRRGNRSRKGKLRELAEFIPAYAGFRVAEMLPLQAAHLVSRALGAAFYFLLPRRRRIALGNLRHVFAGAKTEREIRALARQSCYSLVASLFETAKFLADLKRGSAEIRAAEAEVELLFRKAKELHLRARGCIFVTPHLGNWELLPYVAARAGIPLVIVARPLDNPRLEELLYRYRTASGQLVIPKTNSIFFLQRALRAGKSIGLLPDQSTMKAISVDYLGRKATTTPVPAFLATLYQRPIVVVACCRKPGYFRYEGFVSDPIWPNPDGNERAEIFRLTEEMNRSMGAIVERYPEQYFWMHDRWKVYHTKPGLSL
ncbi:MAG TPA: hypothetical protein VNL14_17800 [Candidatus Acidoferrales bacterium]|nr:hypothetical protein [Candidatus Acidoferrales bacterium]